MIDFNQILKEAQNGKDPMQFVKGFTDKILKESEKHLESLPEEQRKQSIKILSQTKGVLDSLASPKQKKVSPSNLNDFLDQKAKETSKAQEKISQLGKDLANIFPNGI